MWKEWRQEKWRRGGTCEGRHGVQGVENCREEQGGWVEADGWYWCMEGRWGGGMVGEGGGR